MTHGKPAPAPVGDLNQLDERALVALHRHPNEWFVRQARRVLADRAARGEPLVEASKHSEASWPMTPTPSESSGDSGRSTSSARPAIHSSVRSWTTKTNPFAPGPSGC